MPFQSCFTIYDIAQEETTFSPTMDTISVKIKKSLPKLTGSLKKTIPIITVPTAPIPVQTA